MSDNGYSMEIDVMPLITGFLPLPRVQLLKYKTKGDKHHKGTNLTLNLSYSDGFSQAS